MVFNEVIGQRRVKQILESSFRRNRLAHAYLFYGLPGVGKDAMGITLAKSLNCKQEDLDVCGKCAVCKGIMRLEHPVFRLTLPVPTRPKSMKETKYQEILRERALQRMNNPYKEVLYGPEITTLPIIGIDQIRQMKQEVMLKLAGGGFRVLLLSQADRLTVAAANSLLKLLEEPPQGTILVLTTSYVCQLLDTLVSRCQAVRFDPLREDEIEEALTQRWQLSEEKAKFISKMAGGSLLRALSLAEEGFEEKREVAFSFLEYSLSQNPIERMNGVEKLLNGRDKLEIKNVLQILLVWLRDLLHLQVGQEDRLLNFDQMANLEKIREKWPHFHVEGGMKCVERAIDFIEKNVYILLIMHSLSLDLKKCTVRDKK